MSVLLVQIENIVTHSAPKGGDSKALCLIDQSYTEAYNRRHDWRPDYCPSSQGSSVSTKRGAEPLGTVRGKPDPC